MEGGLDAEKLTLEQAKASDTPQTIKEIREHNAAWAVLCVK